MTRVAWFLHYKVSRVQRCRNRHVDVVVVHRINSKWKRTTPNLLHAVCTREFSGLLCVSERETPPEPQGDAERKQQTFSLEPSAHRSQGAAGVPTDSGGMWIAPTFIPVAVPAQEDCHGHRGQTAEKKWSSRARGGFPHRFRDTSMLSRRLTAERKPRDVKFGRLGMVTIKVSVAWKSSR